MSPAAIARLTHSTGLMWKINRSTRDTGIVVPRPYVHPPANPVQTLMVTYRDQLQVGQSIVGFYTVLVMYLKSIRDRAMRMLPYPSVLKSSYPVGCGDTDIPLRCQSALRLETIMVCTPIALAAFRRTTMRAELPSATCLIRPHAKRLTAFSASRFNGWDVRLRGHWMLQSSGVNAGAVSAAPGFLFSPIISQIPRTCQPDGGVTRGLVGSELLELKGRV